MLSLNLSLSVDADTATPTTVVRDLGVHLDNQLTMKKHISVLTRTCFFYLPRPHQVRRTVGREVTQRLVSAVILSRLDYCNAVIAGLPDATNRPLQGIQNSAARLIAGVSSPEHIIPVLHQLHWLPVEYRQVQLGVLMHHIHRGQRPHCLSDSVQLVVAATTQPGLRSASSAMYRMPTLKTCFWKTSVQPCWCSCMDIQHPSRPQHTLNLSAGF